MSIIFQSFQSTTPAVIQSYLEMVWAGGNTEWSPAGPSLSTKPTPTGTVSLAWEHLIYAYMIENTMLYEIVGKVIREYTTGENLAPPDETAAQWLRLTEELFYRHPAATLSYAVESEIRPDHRAIRRNAYYRMFGMDLNHGAEQQPYPYVRPAAANRSFVAVLEELLRELWIASINVQNFSGANPTDNARIGEKAQELHDMLIIRRLGWNLAREEYYAVALMGWLEMSISSNSMPIVASLKAEGPSASARLGKIAGRVGIPIPKHVHEYLSLAAPLSDLLQAIEGTTTWNAATAVALYSNGIIETILAIVDNWS